MTIVDLLPTIWPILAVLGYLLVKNVLAVLASAHQFEVSRHDLIRNSRIKRLQYLAAMSQSAATRESTDDEELTV